MKDFIKESKCINCEYYLNGKCGQQLDYNHPTPYLATIDGSPPIKQLEKVNPDDTCGYFSRYKGGILKNPALFELIMKEFDKRITGEEKSKKAIFLSLCSIWLKDLEVPLNLFVSSESSAGKSYICKNIVKIFPKELYEYRTKISPETFTYWHTNEDDWSWDNKICYLEDISQNLLDSPTFRIMCSEGSETTIVRNQKAVDLFVNGKPCVLVTTARTNPSSEVLNRFLIVQLDESSKQTERITKEQALQLTKEKYNIEIIDSFRRLKRKSVYVPFGDLIHQYLTKNYTFNDLRMRRDFSRLISLIMCSAVLHQYQREEDNKNRIIATEKDYEIAREIINYITTITLKGLTHKLKRAYDTCLKIGEFTAKNIHSKYPFVSQPMWYKYLDDLCERGLLEMELVGSSEAKQRVKVFRVPKKLTFNLPKFEELNTEETENVTTKKM